MDITHYIAQYGYVMLIIGSLAESETITLLGGVMAYQEALKFPPVVLSVALGGMIGGQLLCSFGRRFDGKILRRFPRHQAKIHYAQKTVQQCPYLFVVGTRSMYGFRVIGPLPIGVSHLPPEIFLPLNTFGVFVWAPLFTALGYIGGEVIAPWPHSLNQHIKRDIWLVLVIGIIAGVHWWMKRRSTRKAQ